MLKFLFEFSQKFEKGIGFPRFGHTVYSQSMIKTKHIVAIKISWKVSGDVDIAEAVY